MNLSAEAESLLGGPGIDAADLPPGYEHLAEPVCAGENALRNGGIVRVPDELEESEA